VMNARTRKPRFEMRYMVTPFHVNAIAEDAVRQTTRVQRAPYAPSA